MPSLKKQKKKQQRTKRPETTVNNQFKFHVVEGKQVYAKRKYTKSSTLTDTSMSSSEDTVEVISIPYSQQQTNSYIEPGNHDRARITIPYPNVVIPSHLHSVPMYITGRVDEQINRTVESKAPDMRTAGKLERTEGSSGMNMHLNLLRRNGFSAPSEERISEQDQFLQENEFGEERVVERKQESVEFQSQYQTSFQGLLQSESMDDLEATLRVLMASLNNQSSCQPR